jgi:thymidylate synthase (FAD)
MTVELLDFMGNDDAVVDAARVSFHKEASNYTKEQNIKLITYLAKHGHWTPFGHCFLKFRIKAPVFVARQLVKHQVGLCWNEVSRRYVDDEPEFWFPKVWRGKPVNAKQGSSDETVDILIEHGTDGKNGVEDPFYDSVLIALEAYQHMLNRGVAPEQARVVLPLNCHTEWVWSGSLAAFGRVCKLRLDAHAQKETAEVAQLIHDAVPEQFKYSWAALMI